MSSRTSRMLDKELQLMPSDTVIRPLVAAEMNTLKQWAAEEGWKPGSFDMDIYHQISPDGILGIFYQGQLVGASAVFNYSSGFAFFGLYIVKPEHRGKGFGLLMTRQRLHMAGYRNIGLDGVQEKIATYRRVGFRSAHLNQRFSFCETNVPESEEVTNLEHLPYEQIMRYDQRIFPANRSSFLKLWIQHPAMHGKAIIEEGELQGYMILRPCVGDEWRLGSFVASSVRTAEKLLQSALHHSNGKKLYIDMPTCNPHLQIIINKYNGEHIFESTRMYRGYQPDLDYDKLYGLTSLEAG